MSEDQNLISTQENQVLKSTSKQWRLDRIKGENLVSTSSAVVTLGLVVFTIVSVEEDWKLPVDFAIYSLVLIAVLGIVYNYLLARKVFEEKERTNQEKERTSQEKDRLLQAKEHILELERDAEILQSEKDQINIQLSSLEDSVISFQSDFRRRFKINLIAQAISRCSEINMRLYNCLHYKPSTRKTRSLYKKEVGALCETIRTLLEETYQQKCAVILFRSMLKTHFEKNSKSRIKFEFINSDTDTSNRNHFNNKTVINIDDIKIIETLISERDERDFIAIQDIAEWERANDKHFHNNYNVNWKEHYNSMLVYPLYSDKMRRTNYLPAGFLWIDSLKTSIFDEELLAGVETLSKLCYSAISAINEFELKSK